MSRGGGTCGTPNGTKASSTCGMASGAMSSSAKRTRPPGGTPLTQKWMGASMCCNSSSLKPSRPMAGNLKCRALCGPATFTKAPASRKPDSSKTSSPASRNCTKPLPAGRPQMTVTFDATSSVPTPLVACSHHQPPAGRFHSNCLPKPGRSPTAGCEAPSWAGRRGWAVAGLGTEVSKLSAPPVLPEQTNAPLGELSPAATAAAATAPRMAAWMSMPSFCSSSSKVSNHSFNTARKKFMAPCEAASGTFTCWCAPPPFSHDFLSSQSGFL
mmetsp:Transcript_87179/g.227584  ORF Transcript_87179/g.227584 Transcript_87179/m.227584 type:complete len:270 (+) Transcript_87179:155-964(+)